VDARPRFGGEQQRGSAAHAETDDPDPAGATVVPGQPGTRGVDVIERWSPPDERIPEVSSTSADT